MAGVSNIDRFIIFFWIIVSIRALSNVIYLDYFAEKEETITDGTNFTYFTADKVQNPELRPVDTFVRRPTQTVPNHAIHPDMIMVGSGFKVSQNVWFTARHVVDGCKKVFVNEDYDKGEIIFQAKCSVLPNDSSKLLSKKIQKLEHQFYPIIIEKLITNEH